MKDLVAAAGAVREGIAAIQNVAQLLRSPRVGPRSLERAVPDLAVAATQLQGALAEFRDVVSERLGDDVEGRQAVAALEAHGAGRVDELIVEIEAGSASRPSGTAGRASGGPTGRASGSGPLGARRRLALEARVRRVAAELEGVLDVADVLVMAADAQPTQGLDLGVLLRERWQPRPGSASSRRADARVQVELDASIGEPITGDARLIGALVEIAVALVARGGHAALRVEPAAGRVRIRVRGVPAAGPHGNEIVSAPMRALGAAALPALRAAATLAGLAVEGDLAGGELAVLV